MWKAACRRFKHGAHAVIRETSKAPRVWQTIGTTFCINHGDLPVFLTNAHVVASRTYPVTIPVCQGGIKDESARTLIEVLQPMAPHYTEDPVFHGLHILDELWNMDKHRVPPVLAMLARTGPSRPVIRGFNLAGPINPIKLRNTFPYEAGAEIARLMLHPKQPPEAKMECYGTVSIFVGEGPVPHLLAEEALNRSRDLVTDILDAFDRFFLP